MTKDEALKLALEALEFLGWQPTEEAMDYRDNAIDAIKKALAQPEHSPDCALLKIPSKDCDCQDQQEPVVFGPVAKRRIFDYVRGAYDLGYNDARNAKAVPGDGAPGYKGRDVEADHGGALLHALKAITSPLHLKPLTDSELAPIIRQYHWLPTAFARAIEAKLRSKNNG